MGKHERNVLSVWTVYCRPRDYPRDYVARRFECVGPGARPTDDMFVAASLEEIRALLPRGLIRSPRHPDDDPKVVEAWI